LDQAAADGGWETLAALREVAGELGATPAQVALAWLNTRPAIAAPLASATSPEQVADLARSARMEITESVAARLDARI
jgi:aryl-alcohol dehydrogenase-like predicted oxidoreductase